MRLLATVGVFLLLTQAAHANPFNDLKDHLAAATSGWVDKCFNIAQYVGFPIIMSVGFAHQMSGYVERNDGSIEGFGREAIAYFRGIIPHYVALLAMRPLAAVIVDKALLLFGAVSGGTVVVANPGDIIKVADEIVAALFKATQVGTAPGNLGGGFNGIAGVFVLPLITFFSSMIVYWIMARLAAELIMVYARQYLVLSIGALEFSWAAARGTAQYTSDYYTAVRGTFYHALIVVAIVTIGMKEKDTWVQMISSPIDNNVLGTLFYVIGDLIVFYVIATEVTSWADSMFSGRAAISGSRVADDVREKGVSAARFAAARTK
jgi:hypothetical protein